MGLTISIVGRPNVGKSTLFNRLVGHRLALVDDSPGVTRDRRVSDGLLVDVPCTLIDTAGLDDSDTDLDERMQHQTRLAIEDSDILLFLVDVRSGLTPLDQKFGQFLRKFGCPIVLVANKCEADDSGLAEFHRLGLGDPVGISAEHNIGIDDLRDVVISSIDTPDPPDISESDSTDDTDDQKIMRIAIVGRPNVGKSTLVNRLVGEDRLLTGPESGITRDSISVDWEWDGRSIRLIDTAGMRRKSRITRKLEKLSVSDSLRSVRFAEIVVIVLDSLEAFEKQDLQIIDLVSREGRAPVIALNKWDLADSSHLPEYREHAASLLPQLRGVMVIPVSSLTGYGIPSLMEAIFSTFEVWNRRISTSRLNDWLRDATSRHPPPAISGRRIRLKYISQVTSRPPTFMVSCSRPSSIPASYRRYLVNALRDSFDLYGVPFRLFFRRGENPYAAP